MSFRRLIRTWRHHLDEHVVESELRLHIDMETDELMRAGVPPDEARRRAHLAFGGTERVREEAREIRRLPVLETWARDIRYGSRALGRSPGFSSVVLLVLVIAIGATVSVFALLNAVVLRPLPFPDAYRFVVVRHSAPGLGLKDVGVSQGLYFHYQDRARSFERFAAYLTEDQNVRIPGRGTERAHVALAGVALFEMFGVKPLAGRLFAEDDGRPGFMNMTWPVPVLLAHDFWVDRLGSDPGIVGHTIMINDRPRPVLGVLPRDFTFPSPDTEIWMMFEPPPNSRAVTSHFGLNVVAKLAKTATAASAEAELARILPEVVGLAPDATPERMAELRLTPRVVPLKEAIIGDTARVLWTLFGGMLCLLAVALSNVGGLLLIRAENRRPEIAIRRALGAGATEIARLFLAEALILTTSAAAIGLVAARIALGLAMAWAPEPLPRTSEIGLDSWTVAFAAIAAILIAVFYAVVSVRPQLRAPRLGQLGGSAWATLRQRTHGLRNPLVAVQVTLALMLMIGSALMVQTYVNLSRRNLGFAPDHLLTVQVGLASGRYHELARLYGELVERVRQVPGVADAAAASFLPLTSGEDRFPVRAGDEPVLFKFFTPGYFRAMATPILTGDPFADRTPGSVPRPVLVSSALARRLYPGVRVVGQPLTRFEKDGSAPVRVEVGSDGRVEHVPALPFTIAGVVADVRETTLRDEPAEVVYVPIADPPIETSISPVDMTVVIRTRVPPLSITRAVRDAIASVDASLSVGQVRTMDEIVQSARGTETFVGVLLLFAAGASLLLGVVGIYGSVAHEVGRRTREIGIRLALGARRTEVVRLVLSGTAQPLLMGTAAGLAAAFVATEALRSLLFGVAPADPVIFISVTGALLGAGALAAVLAGRRAARISPVRVLRGE